MTISMIEILSISLIEGVLSQIVRLQLGWDVIWIIVMEHSFFNPEDLIEFI